MALPIEHAIDAQKMESDGIVDLFEIHMISGARFYFKNNDRVDWQGKTYEGWAGQLAGVETNADEQEGRPTLIIANAGNDPQDGTFNINSLFSPFIESGALDGATVYRRRLLRTHLDADLNICQTRRWIAIRIANMDEQTLTLELRSPTEGTMFQVPARMYMPPEFPTVSIS